MKTLIVDDDPAALAIAKAHLGKELLEVVSACGGPEGLDQARRQEPDLILLDIDMPGMSGFQVCEALKEDPQLSTIPVIFLTGSSGMDTLEHGLDLGAIDYVRKPFDGVELRARVRSALRTKHLQDLLVKLANVDPLTEILNRRGFAERLGQEWDRTRRYGSVFALLMADIDHFKRINDTYGHPTGDRLLRIVAQTLAAGCREADVVARYGGEEFTVLLPQQTVDSAVSVAERLRQNIAAINLSVPHGNEKVTASFGVADSTTCPPPDDVIQAADQALYAAKQGGRNRVAVSVPGNAAANHAGG